MGETRVGNGGKEWENGKQERRLGGRKPGKREVNELLDERI